jgi:hypothetical protein
MASPVAQRRFGYAGKQREDEMVSVPKEPAPPRRAGSAATASPDRNSLRRNTHPAATHCVTGLLGATSQGHAGAVAVDRHVEHVIDPPDHSRVVPGDGAADHRCSAGAVTNSVRDITKAVTNVSDSVKKALDTSK